MIKFKLFIFLILSIILLSNCRLDKSTCLGESKRLKEKRIEGHILGKYKDQKNHGTYEMIIHGNDTITQSFNHVFYQKIWHKSNRGDSIYKDLGETTFYLIEWK